MIEGSTMGEANSQKTKLRGMLPLKTYLGPMSRMSSQFILI